MVTIDLGSRSQCWLGKGVGCIIVLRTSLIFSMYTEMHSVNANCLFPCIFSLQYIITPLWLLFEVNITLLLPLYFLPNQDNIVLQIGFRNASCVLTVYYCCYCQSTGLQFMSIFLYSHGSGFLCRLCHHILIPIFFSGGRFYKKIIIIYIFASWNVTTYG